MTRNEDMLVMALQDSVYETAKTFLKNELAIKAGITGLNIHIEDGYVNAEWKFGERKEGDIVKDE